MLKYYHCAQTVHSPTSTIILFPLWYFDFDIWSFTLELSGLQLCINHNIPINQIDRKLARTLLKNICWFGLLHIKIIPDSYHTIHCTGIEYYQNMKYLMMIRSGTSYSETWWAKTHQSLLKTLSHYSWKVLIDTFQIALNAFSLNKHIGKDNIIIQSFRKFISSNARSEPRKKQIIIGSHRSGHLEWTSCSW